MNRKQKLHLILYSSFSCIKIRVINSYNKRKQIWVLAHVDKPNMSCYFCLHSTSVRHLLFFNMSLYLSYSFLAAYKIILRNICGGFTLISIYTRDVHTTNTVLSIGQCIGVWLLGWNNLILGLTQAGHICCAESWRLHSNIPLYRCEVSVPPHCNTVPMELLLWYWVWRKVGTPTTLTAHQCTGHRLKLTLS